MLQCPFERVLGGWMWFSGGTEEFTLLIEDEVGRDEGQFLPANKAGWNVTRMDP